MFSSSTYPILIQQVFIRPIFKFLGHLVMADPQRALQVNLLNEWMHAHVNEWSVLETVLRVVFVVLMSGAHFLLP